MNRLMKQIAFVILTFAGLTTAAPQSPDVPGRFQQLQAPGTTDRAAGQLLKLGKRSKAAREFLAAHLPGFVANGPVDPADPWLNAVHLVGRSMRARRYPRELQSGRWHCQARSVPAWYLPYPAKVAQTFLCCQ